MVAASWTAWSLLLLSANWTCIEFHCLSHFPSIKYFPYREFPLAIRFQSAALFNTCWLQFPAHFLIREGVFWKNNKILATLGTNIKCLYLFGRLATFDRYGKWTHNSRSEKVEQTAFHTHTVRRQQQRLGSKKGGDETNTCGCDLWSGKYYYESQLKWCCFRRGAWRWTEGPRPRRRRFCRR